MLILGQRVQERRRQKLLAEASEIRKGNKNIGVSASELIREYRDRAVLDSGVIFALYFEEDASLRAVKAANE